MDIFRDHALRGPSSGGFQLRHYIVQYTLGMTLRQACILHMVESQYLWLSRDEGPESGSGGSGSGSG